MDMNSVNLTGRLTDDPTLRYTADGKAVANLRVAVNGRNDRVDFIDVTVWGKPAEAVAEHKGKGDQVIEACQVLGEWAVRCVRGRAAGRDRRARRRRHGGGHEAAERRRRPDRP